jgi:tetratricopeptide (TPR) repeat protein
MLILFAAIAALMGAPSAGPFQPAGADLAEAKALYANASYEEAIQQLNTIHNPEEANQVDHYLALCLLALGRSSEAEQRLEQIVGRQPLYVLSEAETSPKLLDLFHEVRRRALPAAALDVYTQGQADFDAKRFAAAAGHFKEVVDIADDPDAGASLATLKQLGEGFLVLSRAALTPPPAPAPAPVPAVPAQPAASTALPPQGDQPDRIYTSADAGVALPSAIGRQLPRWAPADHALARRAFQGTLAVVIDERGAVESATLPTPVTPVYDRALLAAAKQWTFHPATKDGKPVKYRMTIEIVLRPTE